MDERKEGGRKKGAKNTMSNKYENTPSHPNHKKTLK